MGEVEILTKNKFIEKSQNSINTLPHPYNQIQCTTKCKILGHMMTDDNNLTTAVQDRLCKAKSAWIKLRKPSPPT